MSIDRPTLNKPVNKQSKNFEQNAYRVNFQHGIKENEVNPFLNEVDVLLNEKEMSLKKKIFSLPKMEALVHAHPRLSEIYREMAADGEERYGYHYNETIMNIIFNDYILNDSELLQLYKKTRPKEKKRRDKSGIKKLQKELGSDDMKDKQDKKEKSDDKPKKEKKVEEGGVSIEGLPVKGQEPAIHGGKIVDKGAGEGLSSEDKKLKNTEIKSVDTVTKPPHKKVDNKTYKIGVEETTSSGSVGGGEGGFGSGGYATPHAWSSQGDLMGGSKKKDKKGKVLRKALRESEENYLVDSSLFEEYYNELSEVLDFDINEFHRKFIREDSHNNLQQAKTEAKAISAEEGVTQHVNQVADGVYEVSDWYDADTTVCSFENGMELNEEAKSKAQQRFMGMVRGVQTGDVKPSDVSKDVLKTAATMKRGDVKDFASTSHDDLPERINEAAPTTPEEKADFIARTTYKGGKYSDANYLLTNYTPTQIDKIYDYLTKKSISGVRTETIPMGDLRYSRASMNEHHKDTPEEQAEFVSDNLNNLNPREIKSIYDFVEKSMGLVSEHHKHTPEDQADFISNNLNKLTPTQIKIIYDFMEKSMGLVTMEVPKGLGKGSLHETDSELTLDMNNPEELARFIVAGTSYYQGKEIPDKGILRILGRQFAEKGLDYLHNAHRIVVRNLGDDGIQTVLRVIKDIDETEASMITGSNQSMAFKPQPEGDQGSIPMGMSDGGGGLHESLAGDVRTDMIRKIMEYYFENSTSIPSYNHLKSLSDEELNQKYVEVLRKSPKFQEKMRGLTGMNENDNYVDDIDAANRRVVGDKVFDKGAPQPEEFEDLQTGDYEFTTKPPGLEDAKYVADFMKRKKGLDRSPEYYLQNYSTFDLSVLRRKLSNIYDTKNENMEKLRKNESDDNIDYNPPSDYTRINPSTVHKINTDSETEKSVGDFHKRYEKQLSNKFTSPIPDKDGNYIELFEELNEELEAFSILHNKLKTMTEDRRPSALVLKDRLGKENQSNFKTDMKDSATKDVVKMEKDMAWKEQQEEVGKNPYKHGEDIEKQVLRDTKGDALKNVGNSANEKGDEVPKRNLTDDEQNEVDMYRLGQQDLVYDNKPDDKFEDRMKADMGDKLYDQRQKKMEFRGKAPMYNKDPQPVEDTTSDKVQFNKEQTGWNERKGLSEGCVTGRYLDELGKRRLVDFELEEAKLISGNKISEDYFRLDFTGMGNAYDSKGNINESVYSSLKSHTFYTDGRQVFAVENPKKSLNESEKKQKPVVNEQFNKMKHLLGYNPKDFVNTKNNKL